MVKERPAPDRKKPIKMSEAQPATETKKGMERVVCAHNEGMNEEEMVPRGSSCPFIT
jgi:hypothetical protein